MMRAARLAAILAPVLGLAALWGLSEATYRQGTDWEVPIEGYDPRDLLRGHYVEFAYDWPGFEEAGAVVPQSFCLEGTAPRLTTARAMAGSEPCAHPVRVNPAGVYGRDGLARGRLYVGQARAAALEAELQGRDQRGIVTIRQREDGSFTPVAIRFRPLTPAERARRDAERAEEPPPPPAIMSR